LYCPLNAINIKKKKKKEKARRSPEKMIWLQQKRKKDFREKIVSPCWFCLYFSFSSSFFIESKLNLFF